MRRKTRPNRLTVWYDADCPMCVRAVRWLQANDPGGIIDARPLQNRSQLAACGIDPVAALREIHVVSASGEVRRGADAMVWVLGQLPAFRFLPALYRLPGVPVVLRRLYRWIAAHRMRPVCRGDFGQAGRHRR
ncbi:MAG: DUF393 domain-containing protein [Alicyclobacillaceae bacterium]|nr:DUF393 domain-containing protein [Alicyclobacillaceae bacterium]